MIPEPRDSLLRFVAYLAEEPGMFRVLTARKHEILPYHEAEPVAQVIEDVLFVEPSPPHTEHVHVGIPRHPEEAVVCRRRDPRDETVGGYPVRPLAEDLAAVHFHDERLSPGVPVLQEPDTPDAEPDLPLVENFLPRNEREDRRVEGLFTLTARPPEMGIRNADREFCFSLAHLLRVLGRTVGAAEGEAKRKGAPARRADTRRKLDDSPLPRHGDNFRRRIHETASGIGFEGDSPPDPRSCELRPPVPAK